MESSTRTVDPSAPEAPETPAPSANGDAGSSNGQPATTPSTQEAVVVESPKNGSGTFAPGAEFWLISLLFAIAYGVIGYYMLVEGRIVGFDPVHLLNNAYMTWWNAPPRMAAIGLEAAPLASIVFMPFALIKPLATSLVALPVFSALCAGILMGMLNSILRRCDLPAVLRYVMLLLFAVNPMFVFYAANGNRTVLGLMLAAIALLGIVSWALSMETRYLALAAFIMGFAVLVNYAYFALAAAMMLTVAFVGVERGLTQARLRSFLIIVAMPVAYVLMLWTFVNWLLVDSPFGWVRATSGLIQVNTTGVLDAVGTDWGNSISNLGEVTLGIAPLTFAAVVLLVLAGILRKSGLAWGLLLIIFAAGAVPVASAVIGDQANLVELSYGLPLAMLAIISAAWVYKIEESWRIGVAAIMAVGLIVSIPLAWNAMRDYEYQDQAQAFTRWVETRDSQEGTRSIGGYTVGIDPEVAMASYINEQLPQEESSILVDENFSYAPMLLTGRPSLFADRADEGEALWESKIAEPFGEVSYMLIAIGRGGDQLRKRYPDAISGGVLGVNPVFRTDRYVLLSVSETQPPAETAARPGEVVPNSAPQPFTPTRPPDPTNPDAVPTVPGTAPEQTVTPTPAPAPTTGSGPSGSTTAPQIEGE
jgi:hypothetical protein